MPDRPVARLARAAHDRDRGHLDLRDPGLARRGRDLRVHHGPDLHLRRTAL